MSYNQTVRVPLEFFRKERNTVYSNWRIAFWRELFQNSIDAGSSLIDISIEEIDFGNCKITFADNGHGMTNEVLEDVYFKLGATTKENSDSVGGFGRARILTCFAMTSYELETLDRVVSGSGPNYSNEASPNYYPGCKITVEVDAMVSDMEQYLRIYMAMSDVKEVEVSLNGVDQKWGDIKPSFLLGEVSLNGISVSLYSVKNTTLNNRVFYRVAGSCMYDASSYFKSKMSVIVDIPTVHSREIMTASRDSLRSEWSSAIYKALEEYRTETVVPKKFESVKQYVGRGKRTFSSRASGERVFHNNSELVKPDAARRILTDFKERTQKEIKEVMSAPEKSQTIRRETTDSTAIPISSLHPDITVILDKYSWDFYENKVWTYMPENWELSCSLEDGEFVVKVNPECRQAYRIYNAWTVACEMALACLNNCVDLETVHWTTGFIFDTDVAAVNDMGAFLINPESNSIQETADHMLPQRLISIALHEVAHLIHGNHDQDYANLLTELMYFCDFGLACTIISHALDEQY